MIFRYEDFVVQVHNYKFFSDLSGLLFNISASKINLKLVALPKLNKSVTDASVLKQRQTTMNTGLRFITGVKLFYLVDR